MNNYASARLRSGSRENRTYRIGGPACNNIFSAFHGEAKINAVYLLRLNTLFLSEAIKLHIIQALTLNRLVLEHKYSRKKTRGFFFFFFFFFAT